MNIKNRISDIFESIKKEKGDISDTVLLVMSDVNRFYLSEFCSSSGYLVLLENKFYLILDSRYYNDAVRKVKDIEIILSNNFNKSLCNVINKHKVKKILLETNFVTLRMYEKLEKVFLKEQASCMLLKENTLDIALEKARSIKTKDEIEKIKKAQYITQESFNNILNFIKPGITELEIATEFEFFAKKLGAKCVAFDLIVASGVNSSYPHSKVGNKKIEKNDVILLDVGFNFDGYMSDMSRTLFIGEPSRKQKEVYDLVLKAQNLAISKIKPGIKCSEIDCVVREFINKTKYIDCFLHATGHGVGLNIHEKPFISKNSKDILEPGMVITIEPGIYIKGEFGVRIEDMILITKDSCKNLTSTKKDIIIL